MFCAAGLTSLVACQTDEPYAATTNRRLTEDEQHGPLVLDETDQAAVLAAMRQITAAPEATDGPPPEPSDVPRWSDLEAAVISASDEIEAAVVDSTRQSDGEVVVFTLKTVEGWPGELVVERVPPPEVYRPTARLGRFPMMPERIERAERLLASLDRLMMEYARKPKLPE
jgi:hypothetical protein